MRNHLRTNKEINSSIMPAGWNGEKACTCFTVYVSSGERAALMARFATYRDRVYKAEVVGYLLSNYIAFYQEKDYDPLAINILEFGKQYTVPGNGYVNYSIGSITLTFHQVVRSSLKQLPIKRAGALLYYVLSAFYCAPSNLINKLCAAISQMKNPDAGHQKILVLQTELPDNIIRIIKNYATENGMTLCELMRTVLKTVCLSKRERAEDCSAIVRLFNLYRIIKPPGHPFLSTNGATLSIPVLDDHDRKYLLKFIRRRKLSRTELLRKAVRALMYVISHKSRFEKRIRYIPESVPDEGDYYYERLARMDFARSLYG